MEWLDYVNNLRSTVLEAYISIAYGLSEGGQLQEFKGWVNPVITLITAVVQDQKRGKRVVNNDVLRLSCSLLLCC